MEKSSNFAASKTKTDMKTIYECSHSKAVKWLTVVGLLIIVAAIVYEMWCITQGFNLVSGIVVTLVLIAAMMLYSTKIGFGRSLQDMRPNARRYKGGRPHS